MNLAVEKNKTFFLKIIVCVFFLFLGVFCFSYFSKNEARADTHVRIIGSSTAFPFMALLTERLDHDTNLPPAVVESTGTGAGIKILCTPQEKEIYIATASRPITSEEKKICQTKLNQKVFQYILGLDGLVVVLPLASTTFSLTKKELQLALSAYILTQSTNKKRKAKPNPYKLWSDINSTLPKEAIKIYGPPRNSGLYEAIIDLLLKPACTSFNKKEKKLCHKVRKDGPYIEMPENSMLMIKKLQQENHAIGIVSYRLFDQNRKSLQALPIGGIRPSAKTIRSNLYPLVRKLYIYIKQKDKDNPYIKLFLNYLKRTDIVGSKGDFENLGLITNE